MIDAVQCAGLVHIYKSDDVEVVALRDVDLVVEEGESIAILGPSGAGKSTLLWLLAGLFRPTAGKLWVRGQDMSQLSEQELDQLRGHSVGVVLQTPSRNLIGTANASQNIAFAQRAGSPSPRDQRRRIGELLELLGLLGVAHREASQLSGGEQQRLAVGVAMANSPSLILADEPTSQLDAESARLVIDLLSSASDSLGATVVVVTHDPAVSLAFDRTVTIRDGRVGLESKGGHDYVVVGRDGTLQLPPETHHLLPPGSLTRVDPTSDGVRLVRVEDDDPSG